MKVHKGTCYFQRFSEARKVSEAFPGSRVVRYGLGHAVQFRISGPYVGPQHIATYFPSKLDEMVPA
jgi:hypothetical protein